MIRIGSDAAIEKWGFSFHDSRSVEIRNLSFSGYNDDAINVVSTDDEEPASDGFFFHHLYFSSGSNPWDLSMEQDKSDGDGSIDFAKGKNMTIAYCHFDHTRKTGLIGGGNNVRQYNVTLHHNIYDGCVERLPLLRRANCHIYNNLYTNAEHYCMSVRACAFAEASGSICEPFDGMDLSNFDTDPDKFYFNESEGVSDVERLDDAESLPDILPDLVGPVG